MIMSSSSSSLIPRWLRNIILSPPPKSVDPTIPMAVDQQEEIKKDYNKYGMGALLHPDIERRIWRAASEVLPGVPRSAAITNEQFDKLYDRVFELEQQERDSLPEDEKCRRHFLSYPDPPIFINDQAWPNNVPHDLDEEKYNQPVEKQAKGDQGHDVSKLHKSDQRSDTPPDSTDHEDDPEDTYKGIWWI